jgi:hypothetical protein
MRLYILIWILCLTTLQAAASQPENNFNLPKTSDSLAIPEDITAEKVIANYVDAIGGAENLSKIVDRTTVMRGVVQGVNILIVSYQKAPNKLKQEIHAGEVEQKIYFNGERGVQLISDNKTEIEGSELEKLKVESTIILLLELKHYGVSVELKGIEMVDKKPAYKIEFSLPSGTKWTQFYNTESFLKVKEVKNLSTPQGTFTQEILYSDYKTIEGLKYAFKITQKIGGQSIDFNVSSIKINSGLSDREFEIK